MFYFIDTFNSVINYRMQPTAFRKFRTLSPVALCFGALIVSTAIIGSYKFFYKPWSTRRLFQNTEKFADEYFEKHKTENAE